MTAILGASIPFARYMPGGLIPAALAQSDDAFSIPGKSGLTVLNDHDAGVSTAWPLNLKANGVAASDGVSMGWGLVRTGVAIAKVPFH